MPTIAIIGANGQVGSEVSLFLSVMPGVKVVPICRSQLATAFLRRCGLACAVSAMRDAAEVKSILADCDVVADFSLPGGLTWEIRDQTRVSLETVIPNLPPAARFVYMSSQMAYGMPYRSTCVSYHRISRTTYGAWKREGERLAFRLGRKTGHEVYVLRLGQVHGELQNVSRQMRDCVRPEPISLPDALSDVVFAFSIAESLAQIAAGKEGPGRYVLVAEPQWTWTEVYRYYARDGRCEPQVQLLAPPAGGGWLAATVGRWLTGWAIRHREPLSAYLLSRSRQVEAGFAARYRLHTASREIRQLRDAGRRLPFNPFMGRVPGARLRSLSDSRVSMAAQREAVRAILRNAARPAV